jgi:hypothetical protein
MNSCYPINNNVYSLISDIIISTIKSNVVSDNFYELMRHLFDNDISVIPIRGIDDTKQIQFIRVDKNLSKYEVRHISFYQKEVHVSTIKIRAPKRKHVYKSIKSFLELHVGVNYNESLETILLKFYLNN